jgi:hypothetical protein
MDFFTGRPNSLPTCIKVLPVLPAMWRYGLAYMIAAAPKLDHDPIRLNRIMIRELRPTPHRLASRPIVKLASIHRYLGQSIIITTSSLSFRRITNDIFLYDQQAAMQRDEHLGCIVESSADSYQITSDGER